jgi:hypothetical protein
MGTGDPAARGKKHWSAILDLGKLPMCPGQNACGREGSEPYTFKWLLKKEAMRRLASWVEGS